MGVFDWLSDKVSNLYQGVKDTASAVYNKGSTIYNALKETGKKWLGGEFHAPDFTGGGAYAYCGPKTKLDSAGRAVNVVDEACKTHDYEYEALSKKKGMISQNDFNRMIRESDEKLIESIKQSGQTDLGAKLSQWGIQGKNILEDWGLLSRDAFV